MASNRYLLLRLSALGDIVFALEALRALKQREPEARVDWLVEDRARGLLEGHPWIEEVLVFPRQAWVRDLARPWRWPVLPFSLLAHVRRLRRHRYEAVLDLHGNLKSGLHLFFCRARRKIGFATLRAREGSWLFARERVPFPRIRLHRAEQGLLLLGRLLGEETPGSRGVLIPPNPEARARALETLGEAPGASPLVCLSPGTSDFAVFKRWPAPRFRELHRRLSARGIRVVLCTGPGEAGLARAVLEGNGTLPRIDGGALGLPAYLEVLREAEVCVAADSGPLHMAQAVGTRVVALFGPKDPEVYGPRLPGSSVLRYPVPCAPCGRRSCEAPLCVQAIPVEAVEAEVCRLLEDPREP